MSAALDLDRTLVALADPHLRRVIELLRERPRRAGKLSEAVDPPALSRHLRNLKAAGLIEEADPEFDAWVRIYNLRPEPMADLKAWLSTEQLAGFKARPRGSSYRVAATPDRAFEVFTRGIGAWWWPNGLFRFATPLSRHADGLKDVHMGDRRIRLPAGAEKRVVILP